MKYYLAVDIGASSGRHIIAWKENGQVLTRELYRFPNGVTELDGHLTWDISALVSHVKTGIDKALSEYPDIASLSIDTWGVDYVLMKGDSEVLPCYAYRDTSPSLRYTRFFRLRSCTQKQVSSSSPSTQSISYTPTN